MMGSRYSMSNTNRQISFILGQMGAVLEILDGDRFRVNAFHRAARMVDELAQDLVVIGPDVQKLMAIDGIGKGTAQRIAEFLAAGEINEHRELVAQIPTGLLDLLGISGLGPKTVGLLWREGGINDLDGLEVKLRGDELTKLPGLGVKKLENLRKSVAFAKASAGRIRIGQAMPIALWLIEQLQQLKHVQQVAFAGSLRRGQETIGDIDLIAATDETKVYKAEAFSDNPEADSVSKCLEAQRYGCLNSTEGLSESLETHWDQIAKEISDAFVGLQPVREVLVQGVTKTSIRMAIDLSSTHTGLIQVDLRIVPRESFGAALLYFTGSKQHNVDLRKRAIQQKKKLNEYGLYQNTRLIAGQTEQEVYQAMHLAWIPPELRVARDELELAESNTLPQLIELADIKAELHAHTIASDGRWSIRELAMEAANRGFHTVAVTDHSRSSTIANGLSNKRLEAHIRDIRKIGEELKDTVRILVGSEVDILPDGSLDYPNSLLAQLDVVVASPHSSLSQNPTKATQRLLRAIENPFVTMIGHPTGRLIGRREGMNPDMNQIIAAAAHRGIALEINANSWRLDLRDLHARWAIEAGVKLAINTDAHGASDMDQLIYGVLTARRAGATKMQVVNCMSPDELNQWLGDSRTRV